MNENEFLPVVRDILRQYLSFAPLKGARLKPLLVHEFERRTKTTFLSAFWMFPKFSDLLRQMEDLVEVDTSGPGDILVRLRAVQDAPSASPVSAIPSSYVPAQPYIQPELWHAFNNPDAHRRRFYHRQTKEVVHFVEGRQSDAMFEARVKSDPSFIEITPIPGAQHSAWMKEFIHSQPSLPETTQKSLLSVALAPYSSQLNRAFTFALEGYAESWRRFRTARIIEHIRKWAEKNDLALPEFIRNVPERALRQAMDAPTTPPAVSTASQARDIRKLLHGIIDALDEAHLGQVLIPATVLSKLVDAPSQ